MDPPVSSIMIHHDSPCSS